MTNYDDLVPYEKYFPNLHDYGTQYQEYPQYRRSSDGHSLIAVTVYNTINQVIREHTEPWQMWAWIADADPYAMRCLAQVYYNTAQHYGLADSTFEQLSHAFSQAYGKSPKDSNFLNQTQVLVGVIDLHASDKEYLTTLANSLLELAITTVHVQRDIGTYEYQRRIGVFPANKRPEGKYLLDILHEKLDKVIRGDLFNEDGQIYACGAPPMLKELEQSARNIIRMVEEQMYQEFIPYEQSLAKYLQLLSQTHILTALSGMSDGLVPSCLPAEPILDDRNALTQAKFPPQNLNDPISVKNAWNSLNKAEQEEWIHLHPEIIGNLSGIPCSARNEANHVQLAKDLTEAQTYFHSHGIDINDVINNSSMRDRYKNPPESKYINAIMTFQGLKDQKNRLQQGKVYKPILLIKYDPSALGWRGGVMTSIGDPDTAHNIAVIVPGTGNSVFNGYLSSIDIINAAHEFTAAAQDTAIVTCMDYRTPDSTLDPNMIYPDLARAGAPRIATDINGLWISHQDGQTPHLSVIGHSYGATTVADACTDSHLHTNDVIFLGSPGLDHAHHASDLHLLGGHMYVGANSGDIVSYAGGIFPQVLGSPGLGFDPAGSDTGGIRFEAETPDHPWDPTTDHSKYYDKGSESLFSIAEIVSGHGDRLGADHLLENPRDRISIIGIQFNPFDPSTLLPGMNFIKNTMEDPAAERPATINHYHDPEDKNRSW